MPAKKKVTFSFSIFNNLVQNSYIFSSKAKTEEKISIVRIVKEVKIITIERQTVERQGQRQAERSRERYRERDTVKTGRLIYLYLQVMWLLYRVV